MGSSCINTPKNAIDIFQEEVNHYLELANKVEAAFNLITLEERNDVAHYIRNAVASLELFLGALKSGKVDISRVPDIKRFPSLQALEACAAYLDKIGGLSHWDQQYAANEVSRFRNLINVDGQKMNEAPEAGLNELLSLLEDMDYEIKTIGATLVAIRHHTQESVATV